MHDGRDRVEESETVLSSRLHDTFGQRLRGQRPGGDDRRPAFRQSIAPFAHYRAVRMLLQGALDFGGKYVAIDGHGRSGGNACFFARLHYQAVQPPHFIVQQADRVLVAVVGSKAVGTDQFGKAIGLVRGCHLTRTAHFRQADAKAAPRQLPRRLAAGETAANYLNIMNHRRLS